jgi:KAP family P-loop domain
MLTDMTESVEEIWAGDLLGRQAEADLLIAYIESLAGQPQFREDSKAFTIAVDAGYGEGKTWFLKRLAKQLALNHPVAFVDAWQDDLADEPLTALVATLKKALAEHFPQQAALKSKFNAVIENSGSILKIAGVGALKRLASAAITKEGAEAVELVLSEASETIKSATSDSVKDGAGQTIDEMALAIDRNSSADLMKDRIADFEAGQKAIRDLKASLEDVVSSLDRSKIQPPIVIVIDELDRCRPTYAVKLLEEIKHLFDVPGLVFLFGMHRGQLAHSVRSAYGSDFDGHAYLGRFVNRHYRLAQPSLVEFIRHQLETMGVLADRLWFPNIAQNSHPTTSDKIAFYLRRYEISARDSLSVLETLRTCCALTKQADLCMPLLLPLILAKIKGAKRGAFAEQTDYSEQLTFRLHAADTPQPAEIDWWSLLLQLHACINFSNSELSREVNRDQANHVVHLFFEFSNDAQSAGVTLANPARYSELIEAVGRFGRIDQEPAR